MEVAVDMTEVLDDDGFLVEMSTWSRSLSEELARRNDLAPLTEAHWRIIDYVREYYLEHRVGPPIVKIGKATGMSSKEICSLFPCGVGRGCYRLAGLPRPSGCF